MKKCTFDTRQLKLFMLDHAGEVQRKSNCKIYFAQNNFVVFISYSSHCRADWVAGVARLSTN